MRCKSILTLGLIILLSTTVLGADKVDDYVKTEMQTQHIAGLSLAVVKEGKIIKAEGYGLANVELNVSASAESVYKIGSVSKQFISAGIMLLVQDRKIGLDDKVRQLLDGAPDSWKEITIRHLLTHTSGLIRDPPGFDPLKVQTDAEVIITAYSRPLLFKPGDDWRYSNLGYFILAEIVRKVANKPWADYIGDRILKPLEMNSTRTTTLADLVQNRANGYVWRNGTTQNADIMLALRPSGAFLSTVLDLAKWDAALYTDKILSESLRNQTWMPVKLNNGNTHPYGFGWAVDPIGGHKCVHHDGSLPGYRSEISRFVDDKLTVVVLTNSDNAKASMIALGVAKLYFPL